jgi:Fe2+ transport system protein FeoA
MTKSDRRGDLTCRLTKLSRFSKARVQRLDAEFSDLITSFGIYPGVELELEQKLPSYIIRCDNIEIAMDSKLAAGIWVLPLG